MRAVIFDLDGTLQSLEIDFTGLRRELSLLFSQLEHPPLEGPLIEAVDRALSSLKARGLPSKAVEDARCRANHMMDSWELASFPKVRTFPGIEETLSELSARGFRLALVSRACRAYVDRSLGRIGFRFDAVASREDVARPKPDPEGIRMLLTKLRAVPEMSFVVGDHPFDIESGKRAGTFAVGVLTGAGTEERLVASGADVVFARADTEMVLWMQKALVSASTGAAGGRSRPA